MPEVFYRKYRPQKFSEFVGQEEIVTTLKNAILSNSISHAYLFAGPRGCGKTTLARLFAKSLNCHKRKKDEVEPCCQCSCCKEIQEGRSIDLVEIDAASHRGIDEVRELREQVKFLPTKEKYKVYILDEAHQLTKEAANALLKTLEEPPAHVIFILATTEPQKILPTIASRCQRFYFRKLRASEILKKLERICEGEKIKIEKGALSLIATASAGALRDAETLLEQVFHLFGEKEIKREDVEILLGGQSQRLSQEFVEVLLKKDFALAFDFLQKVQEKGVDLEDFLKNLIDYFRKILIFKVAKEALLKEISDEEQKILKKQSEAFLEEDLKKILNLLFDAQNKMKYSPIFSLPLELATIDIIKVLSLKK